MIEYSTQFERLLIGARFFVRGVEWIKTTTTTATTGTDTRQFNLLDQLIIRDLGGVI